ncbi:hypothetical protein PFICI_06303 [Pestalotiopsis fici W106-1]|uniref:Epoxide hydrolase N-terminal domain-containing protein n=1 Tax=Pestalotiopsis fici (strain W106-1 / CGMCC3.15140) TaxID=1229662 RepID=W3X808_PESFW|nr:uncharacterized protein PFICI_06303 [Pestalotiopsis fici W106-1]ETS81301.1 hypothetical protein PFICI_06303 [Pestalotiopsis fici W106-1]
MTDIKPFRIAIPDTELSDLTSRLSRSRFPDELEEAAWDLGIPLEEVKRLVSYWARSFDWRLAEAKLNEFPQYTTPIAVDGFGTLNVHFIHQRSSRPDAIPLIFVHGWPGSFYEGTKIVRPLSEGDGSRNGPAFHVVVPSLLNFGFSDGVAKRGFSIAQQAEAMHKLMLKLGYDDGYATQGGDWGFAITRAMGHLYPSHARAQHINLLPARPPSFFRHPILAAESALRPWSDADRAGLARSQWFQKEGSGYNQIQATKPQTVGYALADSPAALLSWIYEKLHDWSDEYPWTEDEICTWLSIYWFSTAGPAASVRLYYENTHEPGADGHRGNLWDKMMSYQPHVKVGLARFPRELLVVPAVWSRQLGHVVYEKTHERGGHFAAWEAPQAIIGDLRAMFGKKGAAAGVFKTSKL